MHANEEALHVAVEPAFTHLIGLRFDERVMPTLGLRRELHRSEIASVHARSRGLRLAAETDRREEFIRGGEDERR